MDRVYDGLIPLISDNTLQVFRMGGGITAFVEGKRIATAELVRDTKKDGSKGSGLFSSTEFGFRVDLYEEWVVEGREESVMDVFLEVIKRSLKSYMW